MTIFIYLKIALLALLTIFVCIREKNMKLYNPVVAVSIIYFLEYGLSSLYMVLEPSEYWKFFFYNLEALDTALTYIVLAFILFLLGYYSPTYNKDCKNLTSHLIKKIPNVNNYTFKIKNLPVVIFILFVIGYISRLILIKLGIYMITEGGYVASKISGFRTYALYLKLGSQLPIVALVLMFFTWLHENKKSYFIASIIFLLLEIAYSLPTGSKEKVLLPILLLIFIYSLKRKLPVVPLSIAGIFFILFLFPFAGIYRNLVSTGSIVQNLQIAFFLYLNLFSNFGENFNEILFNLFGGRLNFAIVMTAIVNNTPKIWDFKLGYTYFLFPIAFIPRVIWPGKPNIGGLGNAFGRDYGFTSPVDYHTSVGFAWMGESFLNFGWFGIFVLFLYGFLYQLIYKYFFQSGKLSALGVLIYAFTLYSMIRGQMFVPQFTGLIKFILILLVIFMPFMKKVKEE